MSVLSLLVAVALAQEPAVPPLPSPWSAQVEAGRVSYIALGDLADAGPALWLSGSYRRGALRYGLEVHLVKLNIEYYELQIYSGAPVLPGDLSVGTLGPSVAIGHDWRRASADLSGALGLARYTCPMDEQYYQSDVVQEAWGGQDPGVGLHALGPWAEVGVHLGLKLGDSGVSVLLGGSGGLPLVAGLGPELAVRLGARAEF